MASCPASVLVYAPPGDYGSSLILNVLKPGVNVRGEQLLNIRPDGFVEIDLEGLPEGFFNAYGGQYTISFMNYLTKKPLPFVAMDGEEYDSICITFIQTISNIGSSYLIINPINNDQPTL